MAMIIDEFTAGGAIVNPKEKSDVQMVKELKAIGTQIQRAIAEEIKTQSQNTLKDMKRELRMLVQEAMKEHNHRDRMADLRRQNTQDHYLTADGFHVASDAVPFPLQSPEPPAAIPVAYPPPLGPPTLSLQRKRPPGDDWETAFEQPEAPLEPYAPCLPNVPDSAANGVDLLKYSSEVRRTNSARSQKYGSTTQHPYRNKSQQEGHADAGAGGARVHGQTSISEDVWEDDEPVKEPVFRAKSMMKVNKRLNDFHSSDDEDEVACHVSRAQRSTRQTCVRRLSLGMHKGCMKKEKQQKPVWKMSASELLHSSKFDNAIGSLILLNAATIGWQADYAAQYQTEDFPEYFTTIERIFCACFSVELMLRIYVSKHRFFCASRKTLFWNYFDFFVVTAQLTEEGIKVAATSNGIDLGRFRLLRILRVLRLVRILRVVRVLHLISELRTIISSILGSFKSLGWTVILLSLIIYIVGVFFINTVTDHLVDKNNSNASLTSGDDSLAYFFGSLARTLMSLWQAMSGGADWDSMAGPLSDVHWVYGACFAAYIAFALLALMNVVTGVFVQTALQNAKEEEDLFLTDQIEKLFEIQDKETKKRITLEEIEARLMNPETAADWKAINVQATEAKYLFDLLDIDESGEIGFEEFLGGCLRLHGTAKSFDLLTVMQETRSLAKNWTSHAEDLERVVEDMRQQVMSANSIALSSSSELERVMDMVSQIQESMMMVEQRLRGQEAVQNMVRRMVLSVDGLQNTINSVVSPTPRQTPEPSKANGSPATPTGGGGNTDPMEV